MHIHSINSTFTRSIPNLLCIYFFSILIRFNSRNSNVYHNYRLNWQATRRGDTTFQHLSPEEIREYTDCEKEENEQSRDGTGRCRSRRYGDGLTYCSWHNGVTPKHPTPVFRTEIGVSTILFHCLGTQTCGRKPRGVRCRIAYCNWAYLGERRLRLDWSGRLNDQWSKVPLNHHCGQWI